VAWQKTFGLVGVLSSTLAPLRAQWLLAFVYGATVKGQDVLQPHRLAAGG
jgi:hypothetical protein